MNYSVYAFRRYVLHPLWLKHWDFAYFFRLSWWLIWWAWVNCQRDGQCTMESGVQWPEWTYVRMDGAERSAGQLLAQAKDEKMLWRKFAQNATGQCELFKMVQQHKANTNVISLFILGSIKLFLLIFVHLSYSLNVCTPHSFKRLRTGMEFS